MSPNMERGIVVPRQNQEEEECNNDSGFCSGGYFRHISLADCLQEYEILQRNREELMASDFYYPELTSVSARCLLRNNSVGTFLVRDSSNSNYLFSLSVRTQQGATNVRILYQKGLFLFDSDEKIQDRMPRFYSVMSLIDYHVHLSNEGANKSWRWEDSAGKKSVPVELKKPMKKNASSLSHLCRIKINQWTQRPENPRLFNSMSSNIKDSIKNYLQDYPFRV